jgi:hypothetical protein
MYGINTWTRSYADILRTKVPSSLMSLNSLELQLKFARTVSISVYQPNVTSPTGTWPIVLMGNEPADLFVDLPPLIAARGYHSSLPSPPSPLSFIDGHIHLC